MEIFIQLKARDGHPAAALDMNTDDATQVTMLANLAAYGADVIIQRASSGEKDLSKAMQARSDKRAEILERKWTPGASVTRLDAVVKELRELVKSRFVAGGVKAAAIDKALAKTISEGDVRKAAETLLGRAMVPEKWSSLLDDAIAIVHKRESVVGTVDL